MTRSLGNVIADSLDLGLRYGERLLAGVTADRFARLANTGRSPIQSNHPAFIYGHLSLYSAPILEGCGAQGSGTIPASFKEVFSKDATCQDDPDGKIYPSMDEVTEQFFDGYRAASAALRACDEELLTKANPSEGRMGELFPTVGSMFAFYSGGHFMLHMGQMSAWRRMNGLGPA